MILTTWLGLRMICTVHLESKRVITNTSYPTVNNDIFIYKSLLSMSGFQEPRVNYKVNWADILHGS